MGDENKEKECHALTEYRLDQIEKKIDEIMKILVQTQGQEIRLGVIESSIAELKVAKNKNVDRWLNPLVSAIVSGLIAFVFLKVGLK
jgi:pyruvate kinase